MCLGGVGDLDRVPDRDTVWHQHDQFHAGLDRFTITFDSANYVYIDDITIETTGAEAPVVIATRRLDNDEPDTVEIVLDRPLTMGETTRFTFDDGVAVNVVEYIFMRGDYDGDGDVDHVDFAGFQQCFNQAPPTGACPTFDFNHDNQINLFDYRAFQIAVTGS